jgi:hypothetical protein
MPCCCAQCGAGFDLRTQQQLKILQRFADISMALAEKTVEFSLRSGHVDFDITQNYELLSRGARRSLALECKITEDARRRHRREVHGAPPPPEREPGAFGDRTPKPLPPVTTEDVESVIGPEPVVRETAENLLSDTREKLLDRFVEDHTPAVVAASIVRDLNVEGADLTVFLEPLPTRDDPWVRAEAAAVAAADGREDTARSEQAPVAKGRDPP